MKKTIYYCLGLIICLCSACSSNSSKEKVFSEWSFQNRLTGEYIYEENGTLKMSKEPIAGAGLWIVEATGTESVRIRNKKSGNYLQPDANNRVIAAKADGIAPEKLNWTYKGFTHRDMTDCGWYTLSNESTGEDKFLSLSETGLYIATMGRKGNFPGHWNIVREKGSVLPFEIMADSVVEASFLGMRSSKAISPTEVVTNYHQANERWKLKEDISAFPVFTADNNNMIVALYNMALEEMQLNLRPDSTFMTGKLWPDTWTRDVVYSIYFAFSWIHPDISKRTLQKQTLNNPKEALQDTGTGGSWPISTDRVVWALAAWEYYLSTGDKDWLEEAYEGLSYTAEKDIHVAFDPNVNLFKGETCSMDWRTHTYPNWFSNENIGESFSSGTNALHMFMYEFLLRSGTILGKNQEEITLWKTYNQKIKQGLNNHFWDKKQGLYTAYLYPQFMNYRSTQRVGIMSNGLCAMLGAASPEQIKSIIENYPLYPYGAAVLYPTIPDDFSYHNKSVWAVWQTPYMYAAKRSGNLKAAGHIMKSGIRQGAMFLTHKENMTHDTGYDRNTALNSDRQLWSVASYISIVYRMLFGMELTESGIAFSPVVPQELVHGNLYLKNFNYRNATLDITVKGTGNKVKSILVNNEPQAASYIFPADSKGKFTIEIEMTGDSGAADKINLVEAGPRKCWSTVEPILYRSQNTIITWDPVPGLTYRMFSYNGDKEISTPYDLANEPNGYYTIYAINEKGFESDLSNPVVHTSWKEIYEAEDARYKGSMANDASGYSSRGYVTDTANKPADIEFTVELPEDGDYAFTLTGSNGVALHDVYCYIRSVFVDGKDAGTFILESSGNWSNWTNSNHLIIRNMKAGKHILSLQYDPENKGYDFNMSHGKKTATRHIWII
ncbi:MAG: carbohydrate-binding protein [Tannerellaceae bacterium]|nr:carbohydrate-binding protein [Tannerellaceae bacterium]